jgi:hypothetical protein
MSARAKPLGRFSMTSATLTRSAAAVECKLSGRRHAPFHRFSRRLMRFRNEHPALRPDTYRPLADTDGNGLPAITGPGHAWYLVSRSLLILVERP